MCACMCVCVYVCVSHGRVEKCVFTCVCAGHGWVEKCVHMCVCGGCGRAVGRWRSECVQCVCVSRPWAGEVSVCSVCACGAVGG